jgi:hypothetical protein
VFEELHVRQEAAGVSPCHSFPTVDDWEVARWMIESGTSQKKKDAFLKL